ncbi:MAG: ATP-binding protein [Candidatus Binatia bacterium]
MKVRPSPFGTVTFRLTLWYAGLFGGLSLAGFLLVYMSLTSSLSQRTDEELASTAKEFEALYTSHGIDALRAEFQREAQSRGIRRVFFRLLSPGHEVVAASDLTAWRALRTTPFDLPARSPGGVAFTTISLPEHPHDVRLVLKQVPDGRMLQIGTTLRDDEVLMEKYRDTFGTVLGVMLLCGGLVGWFLAKWSMSGVERVTQTAVRISQGDLSLRVPLGNEGREIEHLASAFNRMLERIQALVGELKEVTNNIAHDLRSPVTRIRGMAESTLLAEQQDVHAYREMAGAVVEESDRLVEMINTMLEIAQTESGVASIATPVVDVRQIIRDAQELFLPVAEDKGVRLEMDLPSTPMTVLGDLPRLQRTVANLLDNAIKYTPAHGTVTLAVRGDGPRVSIEFRDTGIGIGEAELRHIFDRFYRGEKSRSSPGSGLGLSLALAVVRAHGGDITVSTTPGKGSTFTVHLPAAPSQP